MTLKLVPFVGPTAAAERIRPAASVPTPLQIRGFDAVFPDFGRGFREDCIEGIGRTLRILSVRGRIKLETRSGRNHLVNLHLPTWSGFIGWFDG